jgi:hypothetical protein
MNDDEQWVLNKAVVICFEVDRVSWVSYYPGRDSKQVPLQQSDRSLNIAGAIHISAIMVNLNILTEFFPEHRAFRYLQHCMRR